MRHRLPSRPLVVLIAATAVSTLLLSGCGSSTDSAADSSTPASGSTATTTAPVTTATTPTTPATPTTPTSVGPATTMSAAPTTSTPRPTPSARRTTSTRLPLDLTTGDATQVVTVVSSGRGDTTATLRRWVKDGSGWRAVGAAVDAYVGSSGIGTAREGSSRTPAGSFTLTQAFGIDGDPGTRLPYVRTTDDDYWISSPGPKYNTRQRCGSCGYDDGVNERLHRIAPEYDYAVVIDYNTANAPGGVRAGRGSAFFLHVENGEPTAGCVSIPKSRLVDVMQWLRPSAHPRILIGVD